MDCTRSCVWLERGVVYVKITDMRGSKLHVMKPGIGAHRGKGFMELPCERRVEWCKKEKGAIVMHEIYDQALGGDGHGEPRAGDARPDVKSTRSVLPNGEMCLHMERTLPSGERLYMKSFYERKPVEEPEPELGEESR